MPLNCMLLQVGVLAVISSTNAHAISSALTAHTLSDELALMSYHHAYGAGHTATCLRMPAAVLK